jgi:hypothetical protein
MAVDAYSQDRSDAVRLAVNKSRSKNIIRKKVEIIENPDVLNAINIVALMGMFGALGEAYAVTPDNPGPGMAVAFTLLVVAAFSRVYSDFGFPRK